MLEEILGDSDGLKLGESDGDKLGEMEGLKDGLADPDIVTDPEPTHAALDSLPALK